MMLVTEIYNTLKQAQLVNSLEEYSTQWLNKHKTTASYLIHKKRDLSIKIQLIYFKNAKNKIGELNKNYFQKNINFNNLELLEYSLNLIKKNIKIKYNIDIN